MPRAHGHWPSILTVVYTLFYYHLPIINNCLTTWECKLRGRWGFAMIHWRDSSPSAPITICAYTWNACLECTSECHKNVPCLCVYFVYFLVRRTIRMANWKPARNRAGRSTERRSKAFTNALTLNRFQLLFEWHCTRAFNRRPINVRLLAGSN